MVGVLVGRCGLVQNDQVMKTIDLAIYGGLAFLAYKLLAPKSQDETRFDRNLVDVINKPTPRPEPATLTAAEAKAIAERQYIAMNRPGTNEDELFRSLNVLNGKDLQLVYQEFGLRNYYSFGRPLDLFGWYVEELDADELKRMQLYWYKSGLRF